MSVAENLLLGAYPRRHGLLDRAAMRARAAAILQRLGEDIDPDAPAGPPVDRQAPDGRDRQGAAARRTDHRLRRADQFAERARDRYAEADHRELRANGRAILYVSHRMEEVFALCDSVTVLRDGRHVADYPDMASLTQDMLIQAMAGRTIADIYDYRPRPLGEESVGVDRLLGPGLSGAGEFLRAQGRDPRPVRTGRCRAFGAVEAALRRGEGRRGRHPVRWRALQCRQPPRRDRRRPRPLPGGPQGRGHRSTGGGAREYRASPAATCRARKAPSSSARRKRHGTPS